MNAPVPFGDGTHPLFDAAWYLQQNPDVADAGVDPLQHYMTYGWHEGRDPHPLFDTSWYLEQNKDVRDAGENPLVHYCLFGWKEGRDPSPSFSTNFYLKSNPDIASANINPFNHYIERGIFENRAALPCSKRKLQDGFGPLVTVVVPNYNHAQFIGQRLDSILSQTYKNIEIVVLDDASNDESVEIIKRYAADHPNLIRTILSEKNSGSVFHQWKRGFKESSGDLIWICESDDFCEPDFLGHIIPHFSDRSVMIAFGRIQFSDIKGNLQEGLDEYRDQAEAGIWDRSQTRSAAQWFRGPFGIANVIPNVGGCVMRKALLSETEWKEALSYRILGDWYLYSVISGGGRLAYEPRAISYFRQHAQNTSVRGFKTKDYYREHHRLLKCLQQRWGLPKEVTSRFHDRLKWQFDHFECQTTLGEFDNIFSIEGITAAPRTSRHILFGILGFYLGGGEIFPIHLANELVKRGYMVSVLALNYVDEMPELRARLDSRVAIYDKDIALEIGIHKFSDAIGADIFHSHYIGLEYFFFSANNRKLSVPYVVTLHGSYDGASISDAMLSKICIGVDHWVYLTAKNIQHLKRVPNISAATCSIPNGAAIDEREFPGGRIALGIEHSDIVFTLVSRAIQGKGWCEAIRALQLANARSSKRLVLLLCGSGPLLEELTAEFRCEENVKFLGYQEQIHGIYRISDCAILPTRFVGESYPLALIQALQVGKPIIATDIGEIKNMVGAGSSAAGIIVEPDSDDPTFISHMADAICNMADDEFRNERARNATLRSKNFGMDVVAERYVELYRSLTRAS